MGCIVCDLKEYVKSTEQVYGTEYINQLNSMVDKWFSPYKMMTYYVFDNGSIGGMLNYISFELKLIRPFAVNNQNCDEIETRVLRTYYKFVGM